MILELLVYLALHRRGVQRQQILGALWPDRTPPSKTMRNRLIEARTAVNGAVSDGPIWRLDPDVTTDWQQFLVLAAGSTEQQHDALALIRGRPFEGLDNCEWLDLDGHRSEVEARIVDVALGLSETELASGHPEAALSAARAGLRASRYEERLHRLAIRAATASNMTGVVRTLKQEMRRALDLDIEPDDAIQPETLELYAAEGLGVGKNTASHRARR
jgi:DNA-binding SARP family transcriptional activator